MLTRKQQFVTLAVFALALALTLILTLTKPQPVPRYDTSSFPSQFDAQRAIENTRLLTLNFESRVTGTSGSRDVQEYLRSQFSAMGYQVGYDTFNVWLEGQSVTGNNVVATLPGQDADSIAIIAHYDSQRTSPRASEDNATGVGVLLELARVLKLRPHRRGLILVATDAEEWGMIGARALCGYLESSRTRAAISIDYLNSGVPPALALDAMGQFKGFAPLWLREFVVDAGQEWIERAILVSSQDQGPLNRAGIPAVNLATLTQDYAASRRRYHTPEDIFQGFVPGSFKMLGDTVLQSVVDLDEFHIPENPGPSAFLLTPGHYLPGSVVLLIQIVWLLPLLAAGFFAWRNLRDTRLPNLELRFFRPLFWLIPPVAGALLLYGFTFSNVLRRFELYPATPKDPFLYHIPLAVAVPLVIVLLCGFIAVWQVVRRLDIYPATFSNSQSILFVWSVVAALAAFVLNPYAVWLYLGVFSYIPLLLRPPRSLLARSINLVLLLAAMGPFAAMLYSFGKEIFLGWRILWYVVLQAAYGVWSPYAVAVFFLAAVVWGHLFWRNVLTPAYSD
jgi:Peptidase family M28